ncbi:MAG: hypothetical protein IT186_17115 [Acidobacteria bacterium]|nr:hypothetical protein [Acidobacteriota bacterium]
MRTARAFSAEDSQAGLRRCISCVLECRFNFGCPENEILRRILRACQIK